MQQRLLFWTINIPNPGKHEPFLLSRDLFIVTGPFLKKKSAQRFIIGKPGSACLNVSDACFLQKGKKRCLYFHIFVLVCTFRNKDFHHLPFHIWNFSQVWLFCVTSCFWEEVSVSSSAAAACCCSSTHNSRASGSRRCSSTSGTRWWRHNHRDRFLCNTRHRRCRV